MPFPLIKLVPGILKTVAKVLGGNQILTQAADVLENVSIPPEKQLEMQKALQEHEVAMEQLDVERLKQAVIESVAMVQSTDRYVSRARPTMLYAATAITCVLAGAICYVTIKHITVDWGIVGAITSLTLPLFGAGGYYIGQRTKEKLNGNNSE